MGRKKSTTEIIPPNEILSNIEILDENWRLFSLFHEFSKVEYILSGLLGED